MLSSIKLKPDRLDREVALYIVGQLPLKKYLTPLGSLAYGAPSVTDIDLLTELPTLQLAKAISFKYPETWKATKLGTERFDYYPYINNRRIAINVWRTTNAERPFAIFNYAYPKQFIIAMHARAAKLGLKLNQHGLWHGRRRLPIDNIFSIFDALQVPHRTPYEEFLKIKLKTS